MHTPPISAVSIGLDAWAKKLSNYAHWVLAYDNEELAGYVAYYVNDEAHTAYIPLITVRADYQRKGVGSGMFKALYQYLAGKYISVSLEVNKTNAKGLAFYNMQGFTIKEDRSNKYLMGKDL